MKVETHPVLDRGETYPHHNLYYVVSDAWDLEVFGGLLLSKIAEMFVASYCVKMRGGTLRFQAQYLRCIRVPDWGGISPALELRLREAFILCRRLVSENLYTTACCELITRSPAHRVLDHETSFQAFAAAVEGHALTFHKSVEAQQG